MRNWVLLYLLWCTAAFAANANHGLGVGVSMTVAGSRSGPTPQIIETTPTDGSTEVSATPVIQFVFDTDMDTTRVSPSQVLLPVGMIPTQLVWADARTLNILYSGALVSSGAKRVALFDRYFVSIGNVPIANGAGLAFNFGSFNPTMTTTPSFTPAAPTTNDIVTFSCMASSSVFATLTYTWSFGDGATGTGPTATHQYGAPGVYLVTVLVTDGLGGQLLAPMLVTITLGQAAVPPPPPGVWTVLRASLSMNFRAKIRGRDKITVQGTVDLPAGFDPKNKMVVVGIGSVTGTFTMDKNGRAKTGPNRFALIRKLNKKQFLGGTVKVNFTLTGDFIAPFALLGLSNETTPKRVGKLVTLPASLTIVNQVYLDNPQVVYNARLGYRGYFHFVKKIPKPVKIKK